MAQETTDPQTYQALVDGAVTALRAVMRIDVAPIRAAVNQAHSVGHILDPTAYRRGMDSLDDQAAIARAIGEAQKVVLGNDRLRMLLSAADMAEGHELWPCLLREARDGATD